MDINEAIQVVKSNWPDERYTMLRDALATLIDCPAMIRAEARAEALKEAADRAVTWYRQGQLIPAHKDSFAIKQLRAAILADEPKEELGAEGPCCKCVEEKGAPPCEFCGPPAWEAFQERGAEKKHEAKCVKCPTCLGYGGDCDAGPDGRSVSWYCRTCGGSGVIYPAEVNRRIEEAGR